MPLTGPRGGHPTPPASGVGHQHQHQNTGSSTSMEGVEVGGQKRLAAGADNEEYLLKQQQMWREVSVGSKDATLDWIGV